MYGMFYCCSSLSSLPDISKWNTNNVTNMSKMFSGCSNLSELNLSSFNTNNVTDMNGMFSGCSNLNQVLINKLNIKKIIEEIHIFKIKI